MTETRPTITITAMRPCVAAGRETTLDVLIKLEAPRAPREERRRLLNLGIVLDRSGSMGGSKIHRAREAVTFAVRHMDAEDKVSLTIFDNEIETVLPAQPAGPASRELPHLMDRIHPRGSTDLHGAWVQGGLEVTRHQDAARVNRVLLISDGRANVGETNPDVLAERAGGLFERGVSTSTIGVGQDFNERLMIRMAETGGGAGWFVETPDDFARIFSAELSGLSNLFGQKGRLRLEPGEGVVIEELLNDFPRTDQGWDIGALVAGEPTLLVVRLRVSGREPGQPIQLFTVHLSCEIPLRGPFAMTAAAFVTGEDPLTVERTPVRPEVASQVGLLMTARARRESSEHIESGDYARGREVLQHALEDARRRADRGDEQARLDATELAELIRLSEDTAERMRLMKRARYQDYYSSKRSHPKS